MDGVVRDPTRADTVGGGVDVAASHLLDDLEAERGPGRARVARSTTELCRRISSSPRSSHHRSAAASSARSTPLRRSVGRT